MREIKEIEKMKAVDIRTVDKSSLNDIKDIRINSKLPVEKRIADFVQQAANPYCQIINGVAVKYTFSNEEVGLTEILKGYIKGKFV